ncbi:class I SAM-dependent methyltransferase [Streptomyces sp. MZ04]|uniref:class I SAM-dependent methyltransferase n=1 Tax=Streptomyces sp. MZ04 TaxID=2559236 RepID=UPI00107E9102|nr:class I SAM-dependent methyltransferase [Streptomyces sp. MZ04]TGB14483.1 class I SAM-dependent methyltransferase [Streptomyces sp. MZ04]
MMQTGQPSRTALSSARARAVHQVADSPRVFADPLAARIIDGVDNDPRPADAPGMPAEVRLFMALRHRVAEDALRAAVHTRQVVILGAGLDTFAYRNGNRALRVFEVDHPATQAWKRRRLAETGIEIPDTVVFCPVDFAEQTAEAGLAAAGFDRHAPAFFLLLGVAPYLTRDALLDTARFVAHLPAPADLVFDYNQPPATLPPQRRPALAAQAEAMAKMGEPWRSFFTPAELAGELTDAGFDSVTDVGWQECLTRYELDPSLRDLFGGRIAHARTTGRETR